MPQQNKVNPGTNPHIKSEQSNPVEIKVSQV